MPVPDPSYIQGTGSEQGQSAFQVEGECESLSHKAVVHGWLCEVFTPVKKYLSDNQPPARCLLIENALAYPPASVDDMDT